LPEDVVAYQNPHGRKSWFMFDDEIVTLGAGITDPQGRLLTTSVDSRTSLVDASARYTWANRSGDVGSGATTGDLAWVRWTDPTLDTAVGYVMLNQGDVHLQQVDRTAQAGNPPPTRTISSIFYEHDGKEESRVAYILVPNATEERLASYAHSSIRVLMNTTNVQAVTHGDVGVTMANFFAAGEAGLVRADGATVVVLNRNPDGLVRLAVSEPTFARERVRLTLALPDLEMISADDAVSIESGSDASTLVIDTKDVSGRVFIIEMTTSAGPVHEVSAAFDHAVATDAIAGPVAARLRTSLRIAERHAEADRNPQAIQALRRFQDQLTAPRPPDTVDPAAKDLLVQKVETAIAQLS
ncbi:polysaccharide lyase family 8 super-sandwich domain-containing protein, partial [Pseudactinotalea sp. Z1732]|uniref:polysaccharide lyase family 8 super-sandwich domain-containing protein n=1 Tax=Pseudactinotalea sp. Z1732 TaxID=3413026 RepID=UPI003C7AA730